MLTYFRVRKSKLRNLASLFNRWRNYTSKRVSADLYRKELIDKKLKTIIDTWKKYTVHHSSKKVKNDSTMTHNTATGSQFRVF